MIWISGRLSSAIVRYFTIAIEKLKMLNKLLKNWSICAGNSQGSIVGVWLSIIPIWSCVVSNQELPLEGCARKMTANVWYVTPMCAPARLWGYVMSATTGLFKAGVLSVVGWGSRTPTTARSALSWKRTGTGARRLSIWGVLKLICSMSERNMASRRDDDDGCLLIVVSLFLCYYDLYYVWSILDTIDNFRDHRWILWWEMEFSLC